VEHVNEIVLVGRLSGEPEWRALPDDRHVAVWRLIVEHRDARSPQDAIDTIRCVTYDPALQTGVRTWSHGDVIEVRGALRHRFWRGPAGPRGLYEVEAVSALLRLHPPPKTSAPKSRKTGEERSEHTAGEDLNPPADAGGRAEPDSVADRDSASEPTPSTGGSPPDTR
jgi:single-stranded DNA-binding protein